MDNTSPAVALDTHLSEVLSLGDAHGNGKSDVHADPAAALSQQANEIGMTGFGGGVKRLAIMAGNGLCDAPAGAIAAVKKDGFLGLAIPAAESLAVGFGLRMLMAKAAPVAEVAGLVLGTTFVAQTVPQFYDAGVNALHAKTWKDMDKASAAFGQATGKLAVDSAIGVGGYMAGSGIAGRIKFGNLDVLAPRVTNTTDALTAASDVGPKPGGVDPLRDVDGRTKVETAARRDVIENKFAPIAEADKPALRAQVQREMQDVKATGVDGKPTNAYDSLMQDTKLSAAQKENVLNNLGLVREHLASYRLGDRMHPDPEVNWIHTQGELAKVLEAGRAKNLSANDLEDSLLASMYSDSVKFSAPAPEGTTPNFHTHHLDGALAADHSLRLQNFPQDRTDRIVEAVLAHQIAPPEFMGQLYHMKINGTLEGMIKEGKVSADDGQAMRNVLTDMTKVGTDGVKRISQLADGNNAPRITNAEGMQQVDFSPAQQKVFGLSGTDRWILPYDPAFDPKFAALSPEAKLAQLSRESIARNLIDGDGIDNYATTGGASKIAAIRGPGTFFPDPTVWDSIDSIDKSFKDARTVLTPEGQAIADRNMASRNKVTDRESGALKAHMDAWLKTNKGLDTKTDHIPFYNEPLVYPKAGETPTADQANQMQLAKDIRSEVVDFLRRDHRTDNSLPGLFQPVRGTAH